MKRPRQPVKAFTLETKDNKAVIYLYDVIDWYFDNAKDFSRELLAAGDVDGIELHINSPGGNVFDGIAIYNTLLAHKAKVTVHIDGLAASIASIIMLAGDDINIAENAMVMVHAPWSYAMGDSAEMRRQADMLDKVALTLKNTYVSRAEAKPEDVDTWMKEDTWFTAEEALAAGLVDNVTQSNKAAASLIAKFDLSEFHNVPKSLLGEGNDHVTTPPAKTDPEPDKPLSTPLRNYWEMRVGASNASR